MMIDLLIKNIAYLVTLNNSREVITDATIAIDKGIIIAAGKTLEIERQYFDAQKVIDASQHLVMPGLINAHSHTSQQLAKGLGGGAYYPTYLKERIQRYDKGLTAKDAYYATLLACIEAIRSGVTCLLDTVTVHSEQIEQAIFNSGIRAVLYQGAVNPGLEENDYAQTLEQITERVERCDNNGSGLIRPGLAVTGMAAHEQYITRLKELAQHYNLCLSANLGINRTNLNRHKELFAGELPLKRWDSLGLLDDKVIFNHVNYITEEELDILLTSGSSVVHCPTAGFGSGLGSLHGYHRKLIRNGITVALGSSSVAHNGSTDMFKVAYSLGAHRDFTEDATLFPPEKMLEIICLNGARCSAWPKEIGTLTQGKKADLIMVKTNSVSWTPLNNPISNLLMSGSSADVDTVVIAGKIIMGERKIHTLSEEDILLEAEARGLNLAESTCLDSVVQTYWPIV